MPKRSKRYNPLKNASRIASNALKNKAICFVTGTPQCILVSTKTLQQLPVTESLYSAISKFPYAWSVYIAAFGKDAEKKPYMKSSVVEAQAKYYQVDLVDVLNAHHKVLNESMNEKQFIGCGWIASPHGIDLSEEEAFQIFKSLGAFNYERDPNTQDIYEVEELA